MDLQITINMSVEEAKELITELYQLNYEYGDTPLSKLYDLLDQAT